MTIYQLIKTQQVQLQLEKEDLEEKLKSTPPGILICNKNSSKGKDYYKWYRKLPSKGQERKYLSRENRPLAEELAQKKLLLCRLEDISQELNAFEAYLKHHQNASKEAALLNSPGYVDLLKKEASHNSLSEELKNWAAQPYPQNPFKLEYRKVPTVDGILVRSKSEAIIVQALSLNNIPYRYDAALEVGGYVKYPDFTIRHPATGEYYYWEHVGLLDDPGYLQDFLSKLRIYLLNGIIPDHNLILTFETGDHPLDPIIVIDKIHEFFLPR